VISGPAGDAAPAFTPDGKTVYFFRNNLSDYVVLVSHLDAGRWSAPEVAPFSGQWRDLAPVISADGHTLIFSSSRPLPGMAAPPDGLWNGANHPGKGGNLYRMEWKGGEWGPPVRLPATVNRSTGVFSPSIAADGSLYFMEAYGEGTRFRLFRSQYKDGSYLPAEPLPFSDGAWTDVDPAVAPDESFLIFSSTRPPSKADQLELFIVFRKHSAWGEPQHFGAEINAYAPIIESRLGPDGHTLYFSSAHVNPPVYPKDQATTAQSLADMQGWNDGLNNIWQVDISGYLPVKEK
jgi:Tol biopolymer transport system component